MSKSENKILTELPRYMEGGRKGKVNCQAMEGMDLELLYDDEVYSVKIVEYVKYTKGNNPKFKIRYKENTTLIDCNSFINSCRFGGVLTEWKVIEGDNKNKILSNVPFKGNKVHYKSMKGLNLKLLYKNKIYEVKIVDYISTKNPRFKIEYNGEIKEITCGDFKAGKFGGILNKVTKSFKFKIGDEIKDEGRDIVIIDREYRERKHANGKWVINDKWYKYKCNKCGWDEGWIVESALLKLKQGCSCCSNQTVVEDINSIWTTDRWMCGLGLSEEDAKTHTKCSDDKVVVICPECNKKKEIIINKIYRRKSICCSCGDGTSYPEKFVMNVLDQLNIEYIFQLTKTTFDWCGDKRYDFYIPLTKSVLETHGMQHYKWTGRGRTLEEEQENDRIKYELALQNGIKDEDYMVIDCRYSDKEYIKNNILKSKLNKLFDLSKVDWEKCEEFVLCNLVKSVCDYWNNDKKDWETTADLEKIFKMNRGTIANYLKKGTELGWCNYNAKEELEKGRRRGKVVAMYDLDGNFIMEEISATKLKERCLKELNINLNTSTISAVCLGKLKTHKGYIFKYID